MEVGEFHWRNGWFFKRMDDGSVRIWHRGATVDVLNVPISIPPSEWASIVCSVSRDGESCARWNQAQDFHGRLEVKPREAVPGMNSPARPQKDGS